MKHTIWKYELKLQDEQVVEMPEGAEILSFQVQNGVMCIWCLVDPTDLNEERLLMIHGTGHPTIQNHERYVGTVQLEGFVWHLFDAS